MQTNFLGQDFIHFIKKYHLVDKEVDISTVGHQKMNSSKAQGKTVASFYNDETIGLVREKEELIISKFSYDFDRLWGLKKQR